MMGIVLLGWQIDESVQKESWVEKGEIAGNIYSNLIVPKPSLCYYIYVMTALPTVAIELIPDPELGGFTAFIPELPALGEGKTEQEAIEDLKEGIALYIEEFGLEEALSRIVSLSRIRTINFGDLVTV